MTSDRLQRLIALKRATSTPGQLEYVDQLMTDTALWTERPAEVERVAGILDHLIGRIVTAEPTTHAPQQPLDRSHTDENPTQAPAEGSTPQTPAYGLARLAEERSR